MKILTFHLKAQYWEQIARGHKTTELRMATDYWTKRLDNRVYDEVHLYLGYSDKRDTSKLIVKKWVSTTKQIVVHQLFGYKPVEAYVISFADK